MPRPTTKPDWVSNDDPLKIIEPTGGKKLSGFFSQEKPAFQIFNWIFNNVSKWITFLEAQVSVIIIDAPGNEADFNTLQAYIAGSPAAGDRILVKNNQTITATLVLPPDVRIEFAPGVTVTSSGVMNPVVSVASNVEIPRLDLTVDTSVGAIASAVSYVAGATGSKIDKITADIVGANVVTTVVDVNAGADDNLLHGSVSGNLTNIFGGVGYGATFGLANDFKISRSNTVHINNARAIGAGEGIDFSNTGAAGQILGDYQTGTFITALTPGTSGAIALNAGRQTLRFIKIGREVRVQGLILVGTLTAPVGTVFLTLPFIVPASGFENFSSSSILVEKTPTDLGGPVFANLTQGSFACSLIYQPNTLTAAVSLDSADLVAGFTQITVDIRYMTDV